jgi:hypothetical protein
VLGGRGHATPSDKITMAYIGCGTQGIRELLRWVSTARFIPVAARELMSNSLNLPIGSQTYPHRQRIKDGDFVGLCRDMKAVGIDSIELCSPGCEEFAGLADAQQTRKIIEDHGLTCRARTSPSTSYGTDSSR